jgi:peptidyl-prolyl cis-trans isomerase C
VHEQIAEHLRTAVEEKALRQYVSILAGKADMQGIDLNGTATPLVQ